MHKQPEVLQSEFDAIKDHLDGYMTSIAPPKIPARTPRSTASRHISQLTQLAAKALHRPLSSRNVPPPRMRTISGLSAGSDKNAPKDKFGWDELNEYKSKLSWRSNMNMEEEQGPLQMSRGDLGGLDPRWSTSVDGALGTGPYPERVKLQTKQTKRCPHPNCRHLLIQPDTKSVRMKIKMAARSYLPEVEIGRRRKRPTSGDFAVTDRMSPEDIERRRRERRRTKGVGQDEEQELSASIEPGVLVRRMVSMVIVLTQCLQYTYQLAFVNPLYDPIQIRLTPSGHPRNGPPPPVHVHVSTPHFTVDAVQDAWAYDEAEEGEDPFAGMGEGSTEILSQSEDSRETAGKRSRTSMSATGTLREREKRHREATVEKKGNTTKVGIEVEVMPHAAGDVEVRFWRSAEAYS